MNLQKMGGISALLMAGTFVVGFMVFLGVLAPAGYFDPGIDPVEKMTVLVDNQAIISLSYLIAFVVFGIFLVVLALSFYDMLKSSVPALIWIATAFGLMWAGLVIASGMVANIGIGTVVELYDNDPIQAYTVWTAIESVQLGLGGGNEIVGGLWVLLVSWSALRAKKLSRSLNYTGVVIGLAGLLTVIPILEVLGAAEVTGVIFGIGLIIWFAWVGIFLLRNNPSSRRV